MVVGGSDNPTNKGGLQASGYTFFIQWRCHGQCLPCIRPIGGMAKRAGGQRRVGSGLSGHSGCKAKGAAIEHRGREAGHDRLYQYYMEVPVHFIRMPPAHEANEVTVDAGTQLRHGTASPSEAGRDIGKGVDGVRVKVKGHAYVIGQGGGQEIRDGAVLW